MKKYDNFTQLLIKQEQLIIKPIIDEIIFNLKNGSNRIKASDDKWLELKSFFEKISEDYTDIKSMINKFLISGISAEDLEITELIERKKLINKIKQRIAILLNFEKDGEDEYNVGQFVAGFVTDINEYKDYKASFDEIALIYVSRLNKIEIVDFFLKQIKKNNELVDCYNDLYCLIINEAITAGNIDVVKHIISEYQIGADVLLANDGALAICNAINNGDLEIIRYLLEEANVDYKSVINGDSMNILAMMIIAGHLELYSYLVANYNINILESNKFTNLPLNMAVIIGNKDILRYEIEIRKVDPDSIDKLNITPFMYAVAQNQLDLAKYLLTTNKVNVNFHISGKPIIRIAVKEGYVEMTALLLNDKDLVLNDAQKFQLLYAACTSENLPITKLLIEKYSIDIAKGFNLNPNLKGQELELDSSNILFWSFIFFSEQLHNTSKNIVIPSYKNPHIKHVLGRWHELNYKIKDNHQCNLSLKDGINNADKTLNSVLSFIEHILPEKITKHIGDEFKDKLLAKIVLAKMMLGDIIIKKGDFECFKGKSVVEHYISKWLYSEQPNIIKSKTEDTNLTSKNGSVTKVIDKLTFGTFHNKLFHPLDHNASRFIDYSDVQIPVFKPNQIQKEHFKNMHLFELKIVSKTMNINSNTEGLCEKLPFEVWCVIASYLELSDIKVPYLGEETSYLI